MVRKAEGQADGWTMRAARVLVFAGLAVWATSAGGAEVAEVRVGTHEKSSRIVVELDRASGYQLVSPKEGNPELVIHLDASSIARDVPSKSPVVKKVRVEPSAKGSTVTVRLATPNVAVKELLLANPPRLVFDVTAQGPIPKAAAEEEVAETPAAPAPEPTAKSEPTSVAKQDVAPPAAPEPAKPIVVAAAEPKPAEAEPMPEPAPKLEAAAAAPIAPPPPTDAPKPVVREAVPTIPPAPATSSAEARRKAIAAKSETRAAASSWLDLATSPIGMGVIGGAVLLLGTTFVLRRRRGSEDEDPLYTVMSADDAGAAMDSNVMGDRPEEAVRAAPIWEPDAFEASEPAPKVGPHQLSLGSRPAPEPEPVAEVEADASDSLFGGEPAPEPEITAPTMAMPSASAPVAAPMAAALSEDTERRIADLERRIEQLAEARERLERQVAAQTEELRVQRAAIARTQRVVRSIAKTEELATEPVPRAPSVS
jgi:hypothetical protein